MSEETNNIEFLQSFDLVVRLLMFLARSQRIIAKNAPVNFVSSVRQFLSECNLRNDEHIFIKFYIAEFSTIFPHVLVFIKSGIYNRHVTWRCTCVCSSIRKQVTEENETHFIPSTVFLYVLRDSNRLTVKMKVLQSLTYYNQKDWVLQEKDILHHNERVINQFWSRHVASKKAVP